MSELSIAVLDEIRRIAKKDLEYDGVVESSHALQADLQLDSMAMIVVAVGLENHFRVRLREEDAGAISTVGDLVQLVCDRIAQDHGANGKTTSPEYPHE